MRARVDPARGSANGGRNVTWHDDHGPAASGHAVSGGGPRRAGDRRAGERMRAPFSQWLRGSLSDRHKRQSSLKTMPAVAGGVCANIETSIRPKRDDVLWQ